MIMWKESSLGNIIDMGGECKQEEEEANRSRYERERRGRDTCNLKE